MSEKRDCFVEVRVSQQGPRDVRLGHRGHWSGGVGVFAWIAAKALNLVGALVHEFLVLVDIEVGRNVFYILREQRLRPKNAIGSCSYITPMTNQTMDEDDALVIP